MGKKKYTVDELQQMMHDDYDLISQPLAHPKRLPVFRPKPPKDDDLYDYYEAYWYPDDDKRKE